MNKQNLVLVCAFFLTVPLAEASGQFHLYIWKAKVNAFLISEGL